MSNQESPTLYFVYHKYIDSATYIARTMSEAQEFIEDTNDELISECVLDEEDREDLEYWFISEVQIGKRFAVPR